MTPYLLRSSFLHAVLFTVLFLMFSLGGSAKKTYYTIDFIAGTPGAAPKSAAAAPASVPAPAVKTAAPAPRAAKSARSAARAPEPLPSLKRWLPKARAATLKDAEMAERSEKKDAPPAEQAAAAMSPRQEESPPAADDKPVAGAPAAAAAAPTAAADGQEGTQISSDLNNFPYPWYLQRLRTALWTQWSQRMPSGGASCVVTFTVGRDGSVSEVAVSDSNGGDAFDYVATSAVEAAAPFPPLPAAFSDPTLRVHVKFQSL